MTEPQPPPPPPTTSMMQNSQSNNQQFYGNPMLGEPLPPTPTFRQQQSMFPSPTSNAPTTSSISQNSQQQSHIVGPSDHYGVHHHYNGNASASSNNKSPLEHKLGGKGLNNQSQEETRVCVIVDESTPVIFKIPLPPTSITLAHLKLALPAIDKPNYKYFFKSNDSEFGTVKEEIQDDDGRLPIYKNRVVAWIVTPNGDELTVKSKSETGTCNLTYSTSYGDATSSMMTSDMDSTSYFTETDDESVSCSNYSETTCDTFVSMRRNRHHKNGHSPVQHYHDRPSNSASNHFNGGRHDKNRNMDMSGSSSPTSSSVYSDATAVQYVTVHLVLTDENFLGLHIYANAINGIDEGIYVDGVTENSAVALDGNIESGDKLMQVNDTNLEELSNEEAVRVLKEAVIKRGPLKLVVLKFVDSNKNDHFDGIVSPKEAIHPIDTAAWVAHAQAITIPNSQDHANSATSSPSFGSNALDTDCIRPASTGMARIGSGLRLNKSTTDLREIIQHMRMPEVGLDIRDREWLKIQIPNAFLGSDLVGWLERNVYGFKNSRDAKKFASKLMKEGYIRDPIAKKSFSSKSYYTFTT